MCMDLKNHVKKNTIPLFSVLIANYNNGKFLTNAINSVIEQDYSNWEIILIDDSSTDNSKDLYKELSKDKRIKIYYNEQNKGCGYTKKRCVDLASGDICGYLDPDDALLPEAISLMVKYHIQNPDWSVVFSRHYLCDINFNIISKSRKYNVSEKSYFETKDFHAEHFVTFKTSLYKKTVGLNPLYRAGVDANLNFLMEEVGQLGSIDEITYKYRKNLTTAVTASYSKTRFWNILVQYDTCKRRGLDIEQHVFEFYKSTVEYTQNELIKKAEDNVRKSKTYRLGNFLLKPFKLFAKRKNKK